MSSTQEPSEKVPQATVKRTCDSANDEVTNTATTFQDYNQTDDTAVEDTNGEFQDSGFFDDESAPQHEHAGDKDFILFPKNDRDDDYLLDEYDASDIASIKANYGSLYHKEVSDSTSSVGMSGTTVEGRVPLRPYGHFQSIAGAQAISDEGEVEERPQHKFSAQESQSSPSSLGEWTVTVHRHEHIAYRFRYLSDFSYAFEPSQSEEDYDIEL